MKKDKKRTIIISSIIAAMFIAPLIVFANAYYSSERTNSFMPGNVDILLHEEGSEILNTGEDPELEKEFHWDDETYSTEKRVKIKDTRKNPGEVLRVCLVPMWVDSADQDIICGGVFNFTNPVWNASNNALTYTDDEMTITLNLDSNWQTNGWSYQPADHCFYYTGPLDETKLTAQLLQSVQLNENAYALTEDYLFRLDVLADAIQSTGNAGADRGWNSPQP